MTLDALRDKAIKLANLGATTDVKGEPTNEATSAAVRLAHLIKKHPQIVDSSSDDDDDEESGDYSDEEHDVIDRVIDRLLFRLENGVDMRPTCQLCGEKAPQLRYGKCASCVYGFRAPAESKRKKNG